MAYLIASLDSLFDEFDAIAPERDRSTDGWIGDTSHSASNSDHNPDETGNTAHEDSDNKDEVHAIDVDKDLKQTFSMEDCVQFILDRCRAGKEKRIRYIIFNSRIWEAAEGWKQQSYSGSNPHDKHAHFSASYETKHEEDRGSWGLEEEFGMPSVDDIWNKAFEDPYDDSPEPRKVKALDWLRYVPSDQDVRNVDTKVKAVQDTLACQQEQLDRIEALLNPDA